MVLSLYGHPDSGGYWEAECIDRIKKRDWKEIEGWPSVFWHPQYKAMLIVYVDDFKLAAPREHLAVLWKGLREEILMEDPTEPDRFLGCHLHPWTCPVKDVQHILELQPELLDRGSDVPKPY